MLQEGYSEKILIAKIGSAKSPYKELTFEEIELLKKLKFSDDVIVAIINVTTKLQKSANQARLANEGTLPSATSTLVVAGSYAPVRRQPNFVEGVAAHVIEKTTERVIDKMLDRILGF